jgi:hypothetical protein
MSNTANNNEEEPSHSGYGAEGTVHMVPGGHAQSDDINTAIVAVVVGFSAATLAVVVIALQAWFYNSDAAEHARKTVPQYDPSTALGALVTKQTDELHGSGWNEHPGMGGAAKKVRRIDIDRAMDLVAQEAAAQK